MSIQEGFASGAKPSFFVMGLLSNSSYMAAVCELTNESILPRVASTLFHLGAAVLDRKLFGSAVGALVPESERLFPQNFELKTLSEKHLDACGYFKESVDFRLRGNVGFALRAVLARALLIHGLVYI